MSETNSSEARNEQSSDHQQFHRRHDNHSAAWPIILIIVGIIFLLKNFNLISQQMLSNAVRLWPLILVYIGLDYWTRSNPRIKTIVTILFISGVVFAILLLSDQSAAMWRY